MASNTYLIYFCELVYVKLGIISVIVGMLLVHLLQCKPEPEVYGNWNAPEAVTTAAVIYCLRCLVDVDIPLNQGCLAPVKILIPKGSFLSPSDKAAVVGGNVLTSQRVTDVILMAFQACACSQGCMNNLTFGDAFGYYETIGGGCGAGPT